MPVINDAVVVNSAYDTSGNGGRKFVRLSNGWFVVAAKNGGATIHLYVDKIDGNGFMPLCFYNGTNMNDFSIISKGTNVYMAIAWNDSSIAHTWFNATTVANVDQANKGNVDTNQTALGNVSLAINETGTELHAAWASRNSAYPNSFNIRYAKGTINTDGSVVWGAVEQWTGQNNTGVDFNRPSIVLIGSTPVVLCDKTGGSPNKKIYAISNMTMSSVPDTLILKNYSLVYDGGAYAQSAPSSIFVPQRINGLANGLMAVAWHGTDSIHTGNDYIRFSYSFDGGINWSTMKKLVPGKNASLTADKTGKLFISFEIAGGTRYITSTDNGVTWPSIGTTIGVGTNVSSLFDLTLSQQAPLNIRKDTSSVLFSGSWTVTTNSVPSGDIGQKTSKDNLLTYAVTTDGTMSTITEKVNGVTVGTKTATSGQSLTVSLTQAQWDAVRYGKYANTTGGRNTLTIEMGTEVWTYTFDKIPPVDAQITELLKSHIDSADVAIPAKKALLGASIRGKGGAVNDTDSLEVMANAIGGIPLGKKWATGGFTGVDGLKTITGLTFKPSLVIAHGGGSNVNKYFSISVESSTLGIRGISGQVNDSAISNGNPATMRSDGFTIYININTTSESRWIAIE